MKPSGVLGLYDDLDVAADAVRALRRSGYGKLAVLSPAPHHELEAALEGEKSPVRWVTLTGSLTGLATAVLLTFGTSADWPLVTGGKYIWSWQAYVIIMFELTVLFSAIFSLFGFILIAKLPHTQLTVGFDPRLTDDRVGIWIPVARDRSDTVARALRDSGAEEVRFEAAG